MRACECWIADSPRSRAGFDEPPAAGIGWDVPMAGAEAEVGGRNVIWIVVALLGAFDFVGVFGGHEVRNRGRHELRRARPPAR